MFASCICWTWYAKAGAATEQYENKPARKKLIILTGPREGSQCMLLRATGDGASIGQEAGGAQAMAFIEGSIGRVRQGRINSLAQANLNNFR